jgi:hypothetical protein
MSDEGKEPGQEPLVQPSVTRVQVYMGLHWATMVILSGLLARQEEYAGFASVIILALAGLGVFRAQMDWSEATVAVHQESGDRVIASLKRLVAGLKKQIEAIEGTRKIEQTLIEQQRATIKLLQAGNSILEKTLKLRGLDDGS